MASNAHDAWYARYAPLPGVPDVPLNGSNALLYAAVPLLVLAGCGSSATARDEAPGEQHRHAVADHRLDLLRQKRRVAPLAQDFVKRIGQIW